MMHLDDNTLQKIAEGAEPDRGAADHLKACPACNNQVEVFRSVLTVLNRKPDVDLAADFSWQVLSRIEERAENRRMWKEWISSGLLGLFAIAVTVYFTGNQMTFDVFSDLLSESMSKESPWSVRNLQTFFGNGWLYVLYAVFLFFVYDWLDQKLVQRKTHQSPA